MEIQRNIRWAIESIGKALRATKTGTRKTTNQNIKHVGDILILKRSWITDYLRWQRRKIDGQYYRMTWRGLHDAVDSRDDHDDDRSDDDGSNVGPDMVSSCVTSNRNEKVGVKRKEGNSPAFSFPHPGCRGLKERHLVAPEASTDLPLSNLPWRFLDSPFRQDILIYCFWKTNLTKVQFHCFWSAKP